MSNLRDVVEIKVHGLGGERRRLWDLAPHVRDLTSNGSFPSDAFPLCLLAAQAECGVELQKKGVLEGVPNVRASGPHGWGPKRGCGSVDGRLRRGFLTRWCPALVAALVMLRCSSGEEIASKPVAQVATQGLLQSSYQVALGFPGGFAPSSAALYATESLRVAGGVVVRGDSGVLASVVNVGSGKLELGAEDRMGSTSAP